MKTDLPRLRDLKARLTGLGADSDVNLPAAFVTAMVDDLLEAHRRSGAYEARIERMDTSSEEWTGGAP